MKTRTFIFTLMAVLLAFSGSAIAAKCEIPPCGPGGGDGGDGGDGAAPDYGDLIKLYRDPSGVPYLTTDSCWQPLPSAACDDGVCTLVAGVDGELPIPDALNVIPVDPATCAVVAACATCTQEVEFGRINAARSPDEVFDRQLEDVIVNLATADCTTIDPAGRLVATRVDADLSVLVSTIDSPLQNLAIYRQLILTGDIGVPLPQGATELDTAARGLGAASDKSGGVNVDLVAYLNQIMGLSDLTTTILGEPNCIDRKQEVKGVIDTVRECFLDYGAYVYDREENFGALPSPAYIPAPPDGPLAGTFEYLVLLTEGPPPTFTIQYGPILDAVFCLVDTTTGFCVPDTEIDPGFTDGNIGGFAQASDDARAVISFMHTNQVPVDFETPVPCLESGDIFYDLSISERSGLQVPKNYVNGGEREFFVNVANLGPDDANGTVTVTATADGEIDCDDDDSNCIWTFTIDALPAGETSSLSTLFTITTTSDTIDWTATVVADPPGTDPNPINNSRTATSTVKASGGGGRPQ